MGHSKTLCSSSLDGSSSVSFYSSLITRRGASETPRMQCSIPCAGCYFPRGIHPARAWIDCSFSRTSFTTRRPAFQEHPSPPVVLPLVFSKNENDTSSLHAVVEQQQKQQQETVDIPTSNKIKRKAAADPFLKKKAPTRKQKTPTRKQSGNSRFKKRALRPHKQKAPTPQEEAFDTTNMNARLRRFATPNKRLQRMKAPPRGRRTSNTTPSYSQDYPATPRNPTTRDSLTSFQTPSSYGSAFLQTPASDCSSAISLVTLTQEFYNLILASICIIL